jgi:hypothetical protein
MQMLQDNEKTNDSIWMSTEHSQKDKKYRFEAAGMRFLRATSLYCLIEHTHNEDIWEELQTADINSRIRDYQIKCLQHLEEWSKIYFPNNSQTTNSEAEETNDTHVKYRDISFEFNS